MGDCSSKQEKKNNFNQQLRFIVGESQGIHYSIQVGKAIPRTVQFRKHGGSIVKGKINNELYFTRSFDYFDYKNNKNRNSHEKIIISRPDIMKVKR